MSVFRTSASTTRPQTAAGITPNEVTGYQLTETAGGAARVKLYSQALAAPTSGGTIADGAAGNCTVGDHIVKVTYITAQGETELGTASNTLSSAGTVIINATGLPTYNGPGAHLVTGRKVYMTEAAGATYYLVGTLSDNTTTTLAINVNDAALAALPAAPTANTSGVLFADAHLAASTTKDVTFAERSAIGGGLFRAEFTTGAAQALLYGR